MFVKLGNCEDKFSVSSLRELLTFISLTYWNVLQSITLNVISVVAASSIVDGIGQAAKVLTGAGRTHSGDPNRDPIKGSQQ